MNDVNFKPTGRSSGTLFVLRQSWYDNIGLYEQIAFANSGDTILLTRDAVLALQSKTTLASFLAKCDNLGVRLTALAEDVRLRGIQPHSEMVTLIDYSDFVELVCQHTKQVSW